MTNPFTSASHITGSRRKLVRRPFHVLRGSNEGRNAAARDLRIIDSPPASAIGDAG